MSRHEKQLLVTIALFILTFAICLMIASFVTNRSLIFLSRQLYYSVSWTILLFPIPIGGFGFYWEYKLGILPEAHDSLLEEEDLRFSDWAVLGIGALVFFYIVALDVDLHGLDSYGFDNKGVLMGLHTVFRTSLACSIIFGVTLLGAVIAHIKRNRLIDNNY